ncbi:MAG: hypothetical protein A2233_04925 [Candidatus Kerfeldbacteria bacterium RIFOXYA2_FULL_38_24]|uniref:Uncharacterized protein n=1 Tax=Candidatus Kerfeldbacteria bacterium RIFOXYB2_FULL_38_14 TaxID=1798547 RepID=A0A1G2B8X0_9BACT|nr:MAG: hypothetical protein A2233_04925 [Candidatus Kerfeldbacteria bacterium RIFOXYA2_FULL_38_24]OGY85668.1 MAG: hypothetical protein A2319_05195 [Candidatus Kerfeldbacteria bacterium RIFOXYB2_FULL_38_14]OGY88354.1 MAG: hypothetical protein A2458_02730 [Candidatus Kerfeldbacteria bacterium RIFOXYC2_FULL_38_9]
MKRTILTRPTHIIILVGFFVSPFCIPLFLLQLDVTALLTFVSLFFAILVGFFIAAATSNYLRLQTLISAKNATLISVYEFVKAIKPAKTKKIISAIDAYMIKILDYELLDYASNTEKEFTDIIHIIDDIKTKNAREENLLPYVITKKCELISQIQEMTLVSKTIVSPRHWFILTSLAVMIAILLLMLRDGTLIISFMTGLVFIAIYQTLMLIHEIDSNIFLAHKLSYENPQQVFRAIGKVNYYPESAITNKLVKSHVTEYRVGVYKDFPKSLEKKIHFIKNCAN